ncbi:MAG: alpha/beta hydrolase [Homoserinimonas sp.]|jgi:pimeloyl-ACP methyl ester carboxylesterase|nr:alpha/beta hydrolase [Homoserinimonas sp.]
MLGMGWFGRAVEKFRHSRGVLHIADDQGEGPVVLLIHGIASTSVTFQKLVPLLTEHHRVISVDLLGHGESPAPLVASYTIEEHVAWLDRTIRSLQLDAPFVIVGHSLGALLVSRYARQKPDKVSHVVLISPPIYLTPSQIADPVERAAVGAYLKAYEFLRSNKTFTLRNAAIIAKLMPVKNLFAVTERNWNAFVRSLQNCIESQTTISDIAGITAPVDIVYGTLDHFIAPGAMRIVQQLRQVNVHPVDANDHLVRKRLARVVASVIR